MAGPPHGPGGNADWRPRGAKGAPFGARPEWAPAAEKPAGSARRVKLGVFGGAALLLAAAFVGLILYLRPTPPPVLLVAAANPAADAHRLDVPLDPYGWLGAERLLRWGQEFPGLLPADIRGKAPTVEKFAAFPPGERAFAENAAAAVGRAKAVLVYVGLPTGCDPEGPFVSGPGGQRLRVLPLLDELSRELAGKTVVVLFDTGRLPPDAARGRVADTFVRRLEENDEAIADLGNVVVMTGTGPDERGWESEEWRRTALAHALVEGLNGYADSGGDGTVTASELLTYVAARTEEWSGANRPAPQKPRFFPASRWEALAARVPVVPRLAEPAAEEPPGMDGKEPKPLPPELRERLEECARLAKLQPAPAAFAPRRWRRYRDLLLRYEYVARSGEAGATGELDRVLQDEAKKLDAAHAVPLPLARWASSPLTRAAGLTSADAGGAPRDLADAATAYFQTPEAANFDRFAERLKAVPGAALPAARADLTARTLDQLATSLAPPESLAPHARALRLLWGDGPVRPPEVQLLLTVADFFQPPGEFPGVGEALPRRADAPWQRALALRRVADDAALGDPRLPGYPYAEAAWPALRADVLAGDAARLRAEDALFAASAGEPNPEADQRDAADAYRRAERRGKAVREALRLRDEALADLPYLADWAAERPEPPDGLYALWAKLHQFAAALDDGREPPADLVREAAAGFEASRRDYADEFARASEERLQARWLERERLLAVPPLTGAPDVAQRLKLLQVNRQTTAYLDSGDEKPAVRAPAASVAPDERARRLARLAVRRYGTELLDAQNREGGVAANAGALEELAAGATGDAWAAGAEKAALRLEQHAKRLDAAAAVAENAPEELRLRAERFSRVGLQSDRREELEPAEENRRLRWRRLLAGLALRAARDHATDRGGKSYFPEVAGALLRDAQAMAPKADAAAAARDGARLLPGDEGADLLRLLEAKPVELATPSDAAVPWTTEREREVPFRLAAPSLPRGGRPATWGGADSAPAEVSVADASAARALLADAAQPPPVLLAAPEFGGAADARFEAWRRAFFRGQWAEAKAPVRLSRVPDVVLTHAPPPADEPLLGFRGPDDLGLGAVGVVLDYSPSMDDRDPATGKSRLKASLEALEQVLRGLPNGTRLIVRGFGVKGSGRPDALRDEKRTTEPGNLTYDAELAATTVNWRGAAGNLDPLMSDLRGAARGAGEPLSPIVRTIRHAAADLRAAGGDRPKLLLVLSDGEDNAFFQDIVSPTGPERNALRAALQETLKDAGVAVRLVLIATAGVDEKRVKEACDQFRAPLEAAAPPGGVSVVRDYATLAREMADLLRPRVRLKPTVSDLTFSRAAARGVPLSFSPGAPPEDVKWSPNLTPGQYRMRLRDEPNDGDPAAEVGPGERLLVGVARGAGGEPVFSRLLWGDELLRLNRWPAPRGREEVRWQDKAGPWLLTVAGWRRRPDGYSGEFVTEQNRNSLDAVVGVENFERTALPDEGPLRHLLPAAVWWQLDPAAPLALRSPLYAWTEYGHPAPAWRLRRWDWRTDAGPGPRAALSGWVASALPEPAATLTLTRAEQTARGKTPDGRAFTVRVAWEPARNFVAGPRQAPARAPALVVRASFDDGAKAAFPLVAKLQDFGRTHEVRFFGAAGATTNYFSDRTPDDCDGKRLEIHWYGALAASAKLPLPPPGDEPRADPIEGRPGDAAAPSDGCAPGR